MHFLYHYFSLVIPNLSKFHFFEKRVYLHLFRFLPSLIVMILKSFILSFIFGHPSIQCSCNDIFFRTKNDFTPCKSIENLPNGWGFPIIAITIKMIAFMGWTNLLNFKLFEESNQIQTLMKLKWWRSKYIRLEISKYLIKSELFFMTRLLYLHFIEQHSPLLWHQ